MNAIYEMKMGKSQYVRVDESGMYDIVSSRTPDIPLKHFTDIFLQWLRIYDKYQNFIERESMYMDNQGVFASVFQAEAFKKKNGDHTLLLSREPNLMNHLIKTGIRDINALCEELYLHTDNYRYRKKHEPVLEQQQRLYLSCRFMIHSAGGIYAVTAGLAFPVKISAKKAINTYIKNKEVFLCQIYEDAAVSDVLQQEHIDPSSLELCSYVQFCSKTSELLLRFSTKPHLA